MQKIITQKIYLKNMVCPRCIRAVEEILRRHQIEKFHVDLGEIELFEILDLEKLAILKTEFIYLGFEILTDTQTHYIEKIKHIIIDNLQKKNIKQQKLSDLLSEKLHTNYSSLSKLFAQVEGITLEQYHILQKIERIKELMSYQEMNLSEIAFELNYSSLAAMSAQFKKITGFAPKQFQKLHPKKNRKGLV